MYFAYQIWTLINAKKLKYSSFDLFWQLRVHWKLKQTFASLRSTNKPFVIHLCDCRQKKN
jgi:hypothetical protein